MAWDESGLALLRAMNTPEQKRHLGGPESEARLLDRHARYLTYHRPGEVEVLWNGRASDDECSNLTDWVFPGTYTAEAIAVGSTRATSSEFVLGPAVRPTVTRTPTPTASPSRSAGASPSTSG